MGRGVNDDTTFSASPVGDQLTFLLGGRRDENIVATEPFVGRHLGLLQVIGVFAKGTGMAYYSSTYR